MINNIDPEIFNNEHLPEYQNLKSRVRTTALIAENTLKPKGKENAEFLQGLLLDWYQKWKSVIFIHHKEYYEGYIELDMICNLVAHVELPIGLTYHSSSWPVTDYPDTVYPTEIGFDRAARMEAFDVINPLKRQKLEQQKKTDLGEKCFSERIYIKGGWNPDIKDINSPVKVSAGAYEGNDDLNFYFKELLFEWGKKWNDEIITHYEAMTNFTSVNMTCSKRAYWALPNHLG